MELIFVVFKDSEASFVDILQKKSAKFRGFKKMSSFWKRTNSLQFHTDIPKIFLNLYTGLPTKNETIEFLSSIPLLKGAFSFIKPLFSKTNNQRNWVFGTISNIETAISLELDVVNLWYFKLRLLDLTEFIVWNI